MTKRTHITRGFLAFALVLASTFAILPRANADDNHPVGVIVQLENGKIEGILDSETDSTIYIETDTGRVGISMTNVLSVEKTQDTALCQYLLRRAVAEQMSDINGQIEARFLLGLYAQDHGLKRRAAEQAGILLGMVNEGNPRDAKICDWAHSTLGYQKINGIWMNYDQAMQAKGYIKYLGEWRSAEDYRRMIAEETAAANEQRYLSDEAAQRAAIEAEAHEANVTVVYENRCGNYGCGYYYYDNSCWYPYGWLGGIYYPPSFHYWHHSWRGGNDYRGGAYHEGHYGEGYHHEYRGTGNRGWNGYQPPTYHAPVYRGGGGATHGGGGYRGGGTSHGGGHHH